MSISNQPQSEMPDWMEYQSPEQAQREAMEYELNAQFDRYDGWGDPDFQAEFEECQFVPASAVVRIPTIADDEIPF